MSQSYANLLKGSNSSQKTGQQAPRSGHEAIMIKNLAGGFTYQVSDKEYLERILILGTNSNTYYANASKLTTDAVEGIKRMINQGKGQMVVDTIKDIYESGRAPKQDPTFFALAMVTQSDVPADVKRSALEIVSKIRTFSQLYLLEGMRKAIGGKKGFGRGVRKSLCKLVKDKTGQQFAYQATKYRSRKYGEETWSIDDIIKCAHIPSKDLSADGQIVMVYLIKGMEKCEEEYAKLVQPTTACVETMSYLRAVEAVKSVECTVDTSVQLIRQYHLPREVLNTTLLNSTAVWNSLLFTSSVGEGGKVDRRVTMPITALFRNLGVMTHRNVFTDESVAQLIAQHIVRANVLKGGKVHPVAVLVAKLTYDSGRGVKGKLAWQVNKTISDALEEAFYVSFQTVEGTGKRVLHACDCSGSMSSPIASMPLISSCSAVACLVMEAVRREHRYAEDMKAKGTPVDNLQEVMLFSKSGNKVTITPDMKLAQVMKVIQCDFLTTDVSQPLIKALDEFKKSGGKSGLYDMFVIYTDNETFYANGIHPSDALDNYRKATNLQSKLIVYATTPTMNTIGYGVGSNYGGHGNAFSVKPGQNESLTLNIAGFDLNGPALIRNFAMGHIGTISDEDDSEDVEE